MKFLTSVVSMVAAVYAAPESDRVTWLPSIGSITDFDMFSGYVDIEGTSKKLHYLFNASQSNPETDPVIIWFNGGPGCSSMLGMMQENGPRVINDGEDFIVENDETWNKRANVLWIESPAGVGWSQAGTDADLDTNDVIQSQDALAALYSFYDKFPEFKTNKLFVSGESYAGIYVPYLSW